MAARFLGMRNLVDFWITMIQIFVIASLVYGTVFSLIGTIFVRRAMVFGAGYVVIIEVIGAFLPVVLSRFTARFHLQSLGIAWSNPKLLPIPARDVEMYYTMQISPPFHLTCLIVLALTCLIAGCLVIVNREYVTSDQA